MVGNLRKLTIICIAVAVNACGVIECVDSQFERKPIPIKGEYNFTVSFPSGDSSSHIIKCEQYYDSMCSERGNSWSVREVGKSGSYKNSYIPIASTEYELQLPQCNEILKPNEKLNIKDLRIVWNKEASKTEHTEFGEVTSWLGKSYIYVETKNGIHSFKTGGYRDVPLEVIKLKFDISLNGQPLN